MRILTGVSLGIAEIVLLVWILFGSAHPLHGKAGDEAIEDSPAVGFRNRPFQVKAAVLGVCSAAALAAGYRVAGAVASPFDSARLGVALLGVTAAMLYDWEHRIIPNRYLIWMCVGRAVLFAAEILAGREDWRQSGLNSLVGAVVSFAVMFILCVVTRQGLGMGDVKLIAAVGLLAGIYGVMNCLVYAVLACAGFAVFLLAAKRKGLKDQIPFGPFIYIGYVMTLLTGAF